MSDSSNIDAADGKDRTVTVKYFEKAFSHDKYDELHAQSDVHISSEAADSGKGRRTRQPVIVAVKKVRAAVKAPPCPPSPCSETSTSPSTCPSTSPSTATYIPSSSAKRAANSPGQQVEKKGKISSSSSAAVQLSNKPESKQQEKQEKVMEKTTKGFSRQSISAAVSSSSCGHSPQFDYCSVHDLADSLFPPFSNGSSSVSSVRGVDRQIKRGLLHALYHHLKPSSRESDEERRRPPLMRVVQLQELINECPTSVEQMRRMPLCAALLDDPVSPECTSLTSNSDRNPNPILSLGAEVVVVMRTYLRERGFDVDSLGATDRLPGLGLGQGKGEGKGEGKGGYKKEGERTLPRGLSIPLSYDHFEIALDLAFERLDGRENFENAKGVKGLDYVANGA